MIRSDADCDLLIIGGGALGAFHAHAAVQRGLNVVLVERSAEPRGATVRNFGQVVPSGMSPKWQRLGRESLRIYQELQAKLDLSVRPMGSLYIASDDEEMGLLEELRVINAAEDYASQLWTADQCRNHLPTLRSDYCRCGLFFPQEVSVDPRMMIHRLLGYLSEQERCETHFQTCIQDLTVGGHGQVIATAANGKVLTARKAILCSGHEFKCLYPDVFSASDLRAVKLQMLRLRPQASVYLPGNILTGRSIRRYESFADCPSWERVKAGEDKDDFANTWGVHILLKQDADGSIILGDSHEYLTAASGRDFGMDEKWMINEFFIQEAKKIFDLPSWDIDTVWSGIYSQSESPAGIFQSTVEPNIHIVTGIGGKGMTAAAGLADQHLKEIFHD